ncbi:anthrone oxygenase family protein [Chelativorans intermedius]|uniref:DUF1772 domain-containing protein n=1 Tax=Chelativorans intermedius TaxID=515947 RepID=A0ABV6DB47_9HYPH|nr:anthrone oxygenase family protein [Chelativorans intermedius]MCT9000232.1 DUF1772 domain-containing protein [Chelativorans intermedius]
MQALITALLWVSAIGCGLIAGLYFAFSTFIMTALDRIGHAQGAAAMNSINSTILGSLFMPLFFGTTIASAVLAVLALFRWSEPGAAAMLAGGLIYVVGMFICTVVYNVPLNNELARAGTGSAEVWTRYLKDWTFWNHVRTIASKAAMVSFIAAIAVRGGAQGVPT